MVSIVLYIVNIHFQSHNFYRFNSVNSVKMNLFSSDSEIKYLTCWSNEIIKLLIII